MTDQIETAASLMVRDYLILAFLVSLGALQIAVSISGIRGLWLLPNQLLTRALGILLIGVGITTYILSPLWVEGPWAAGSVADGTSAGREWGTATINEVSAARNINDIHGGMAGTAYAIVFLLAAVLATTFAAILGTLNVRISNSPTLSRGSEGDQHDPPSFRRGLGGGHNDPPTSRKAPGGGHNNPPSSRKAPAGDHNNPPSSRKEPGGDHNNPPSSRRAPAGDHNNPPSFRRGLGGGPTDGLDALKHTDAISTFASSSRNLIRTAKSDANEHMSTTHLWSVPSLIARMWRN